MNVRLAVNIFDPDLRHFMAQESTHRASVEYSRICNIFWNFYTCSVPMRDGDPRLLELKEVLSYFQSWSLETEAGIQVSAGPMITLVFSDPSSITDQPHVVKRMH